MEEGSNRLLRQQQVKVVIRLKPEQGEAKPHCVYLSQQENHLVVQTDHKKEIFVFDHVAHQLVSQLDIYRMIGQQAVASALQGFNCCIFAYGQTGAGKTYSIMGDVSQLPIDPYSQCRGILPRLLQDLFNLTSQEQDASYQATCSFIQIYNEQIYDLLSQDKRVHQIREDSRKGVFVQGVVQTRLQTYKQAVEVLLQGDKTRKIAYTAMNTESSRSHVIFTIQLEAYVKEDGVTKVKKSKLNIVDLAGSERVKYTNVQGERLRQGCNINKSLHVLGNVINSLVQSTKKKKHIPYRDSKLTYYLKDSLGGNSITKLLANVHCSKQFYGDTLSTLMFAKRAKSLKMKVQVIQNRTQNFQTLRKQVRRLREQLAEARYFKDNQKSQRNSFYQDFQQTLQKVTDNSDYEVAPKLQVIQVFQENELHYRSLMEIYEEHMSECFKESSNTRRNSINKVGEWKNLEKRNLALTKLVRQFPAFTKIFKENLLLKQDRSKASEDTAVLAPLLRKQTTKKSPEQTTFMSIKEPQTTVQIQQSTVDELIKVYEGIIDDIKTQFSHHIDALEKQFTQLEHQCKVKDTKIKQLVKQQGVPPDIEELRNQNQYLHLNILNLENQIRQLQETENKLNIEKRQSKRHSHRKSVHEKDLCDYEQAEETINFLCEKLHDIKKEAQKEVQAAEQERQQMQNLIKSLSSQVASLTNQNNRLQLKYKRSGSQQRSRQKRQTFFESEAKRSMVDFIQPTESEFFNRTKTSDGDFTKQMMSLRLELKMKHKQVVDLKEQVQQFEKGDDKIEQQFGKNLDQVIKQYRQLLSKGQIHKSLKNISKYKEPQLVYPDYLDIKHPQIPVVKKPSIDSRVFKTKETPKYLSKKQMTGSGFHSNYNSKTNFFSPK